MSDKSGRGKRAAARRPTTLPDLSQRRAQLSVRRLREEQKVGHASHAAHALGMAAGSLLHGFGGHHTEEDNVAVEHLACSMARIDTIVGRAVLGDRFLGRLLHK